MTCQSQSDLLLSWPEQCSPQDSSSHIPALPPESASSYVTLERLCCHFFRFSLELQPEEDTFWLKLSGGEEVKAFLASML